MLTPIDLELCNPDEMVDYYPVWEVPPGYRWALEEYWGEKPDYQLHPEVWHQTDIVISRLLEHDPTRVDQYPKERLERRSF